MSETKCRCTHEVGDSDCAAHPTCPECGCDLAGTELASQLAAAVRLIGTMRDGSKKLQAHVAERDRRILELSNEVARLKGQEP